MAEMRAAIEALQNTMSRQDDEIRDLRLAVAESSSAAAAATRLATTATNLLRQCVSVQVADSFQEQLNVVVEVMNSIPDQLIQLEGRITQNVTEATTGMGHHTSSTVHASSATQADVRLVEERLEAARRDADQRFLEIDTHIENFLKFMTESTYDPHGLEQRLRDAMRQAATPDEAENRLRYLEREIANLLGFRQDSPCMTYVNNQIEMIRHTADTALARANRAETDIEKLQIRVIRDDVSDLQETLIELMERVSTVEQSSKEHGATSHTLSEKVAALNRAEARSIHDFNLTWEFLRPCLRVLFPSAPRISPMFNTNTSPLVLHATLFSLRRLSDNSRHTPPSSTTSILHRIHLQGTTREAAEAAGPAVANVAVPAGTKATQPAARGAKQRSNAPSAEPAPVINVPVPDPAQRTFVDVVRNRTRTPMASNQSSPQRTTTAAAGSDAPPAQSVLEQAAATALPDSSDSDRANDSGVPTPQVGSPARAGHPVSSAGATTATETVTGPQLVHRTNVPVVQLKASSSISLGGPSPSAGVAPQEPTTSTREVKSPITAEAPAPASPQLTQGARLPLPRWSKGRVATHKQSMGRPSRIYPRYELPRLPARLQARPERRPRQPPVGRSVSSQS
jgi:hypothetical protein